MARLLNCQSTLASLQRVLNAAARLVCNLHQRDSVTSALIIGYQLLHVLNLNCVLLCISHSTALHLTTLITRYSRYLHFGERSACDPPPIVTCSYRVHDFGPVSNPPARQPLVSGMRSRLTSEKPAPYRHSRKNWRRTCSLNTYFNYISAFFFLLCCILTPFYCAYLHNCMQLVILHVSSLCMFSYLVIIVSTKN